MTDLEAEICQIRDRYPAHDISIEWNHEGGWWGLAVSCAGEHGTATIIAFGGSRVSLREAVLAVKAVEPTTVLTPTPA